MRSVGNALLIFNLFEYFPTLYFTESIQTNWKLKVRSVGNACVEETALRSCEQRVGHWMPEAHANNASDIECWKRTKKNKEISIRSETMFYAATGGYKESTPEGPKDPRVAKMSLGAFWHMNCNRKLSYFWNLQKNRKMHFEENVTISYKIQREIL